MWFRVCSNGIRWNQSNVDWMIVFFFYSLFAGKNGDRLKSSDSHIIHRIAINLYARPGAQTLPNCRPHGCASHEVPSVVTIFRTCSGAGVVMLAPCWSQKSNGSAFCVSHKYNTVPFHTVSSSSFKRVWCMVLMLIFPLHCKNLDWQRHTTINYHLIFDGIAFVYARAREFSQFGAIQELH